MEERSSSHSGYCVCLLSSWVHPAQVRVLLRTGHTFLKKYDLYGIVFFKNGGYTYNLVASRIAIASGFESTG